MCRQKGVFGFLDDFLNAVTMMMSNGEKIQELKNLGFIVTINPIPLMTQTLDLGRQRYASAVTNTLELSFNFSFAYDVGLIEMYRMIHFNLN